MRKRRVFKLQIRFAPFTVLDRSFETKQDAVAYAELIFMLHPDEDWQETFKTVEVDDGASSSRWWQRQR